mgnify:CR=1 FL=1
MKIENLAFINNPSKNTETEDLDSKIEQPEEYEAYDPNIRKKIAIPVGMSVQEIQETYHVSRGTAFRSKNCGWLFMNEKKRLITIDNAWANSNVEKIMEYARIGANSVMKKFGLKNSDLTPFDFDDLIATANSRLLEMTGHQKRDNRSFMINVAMNAVCDFVRYKVRFPSKNIVKASDFNDFLSDKNSAEDFNHDF